MVDADAREAASKQHQYCLCVNNTRMFNSPKKENKFVGIHNV